jgi:hypothetical protein
VAVRWKETRKVLHRPEAISKKFFRLTSQRLTSIGVKPSSQILAILEYACGLSLNLALILNENPNFEMASKDTGPTFRENRPKAQRRFWPWKV